MQGSAATEELLIRAEEFLLQERFQDSEKLYQDIIVAEIGSNFEDWFKDASSSSKKPSKAVLEAYSVCLLAANDIVKAKVVLKALVKFYEIKDEEIFLSLAQVQQGKHSAESFEKGITILKSKIENATSSEKDELQEALASAYCAYVELYMSDLCFEADAETKCASLLSEAIQLAPNSIEVFQVSCSFHISKADKTKAKEYILFCWNHLIKQDSNSDLTYLPFEFRVQTCRLLVELEEYEKAIELLVLLCNEDDSITEVWLLLATCYGKTNEKEAFLSCAEHTETLLKSFLAEDDFKDNPIFLEQLERLNSLKSSHKQ